MAATPEPDREYTGDFVEDQKLLERYRNGDTEAFGLLYQRHRALAYSQALRLSHDRQQADDIVLEAFTRVLEAIKGGKGPTVSMGHYLVSTVRNVAIRQGKKLENEVATDPQEVAKAFEEATFGDDGETEEWLTEAFNALDEQSQRIIWMRTVDGIKSREIASQLGINPVRVTRSFQASVRTFKKHFVMRALEHSYPKECQRQGPALLAVAENPRGPLSGHIASCSRCSIIISRLRASEKTLLTVIVLGTLGGSGATLLSSRSASAATSWFAGLSSAGKTALVGGSLAVVGAITAVVVSSVGAGGALESAATDAPTTSVGDDTTVLAEVGPCRLISETLSADREVLRLEDNASSCAFTVEYLPEGSAIPQLRFDSSTDSTVSLFEVNRPGEYVVRLIERDSEKSFEVRIERRDGG